jgi:hypothetical protein
MPRESKWACGSYGDGGLDELTLLLEEWQRDHPGVAVVLRA